MAAPAPRAAEAPRREPSPAGGGARPAALLRRGKNTTVTLRIGGGGPVARSVSRGADDFLYCFAQRCDDEIGAYRAQRMTKFRVFFGPVRGTTSGTCSGVDTTAPCIADMKFRSVLGPMRRGRRRRGCTRRQQRVRRLLRRGGPIGGGRYVVRTASRYQRGAGKERGADQKPKAGSRIHGVTPMSEVFPK